MSDLPRPATPGPWEGFGSDDVAAWGIYGMGWRIAECSPINDVDNSVVVSFENAEQNTLAIAALPDWIERCDELEALLQRERIASQAAREEYQDLDIVRARCEKLEALLKRARGFVQGAHDEWGSPVGDDLLAMIDKLLGNEDE